MIKKLKNPFLLFFFLTLLSSNLIGQILNPVKWEFTSKPLGNNVFKLFLTAKIDEGWHIYSQHIDGMGPIPTSFTFNKNNNYMSIGAVDEPTPKSEYDPNFDMVLKFFDQDVTFTQKVKLRSTGETKITGLLEFMVCDDKQCLPPETVDFEFKLVGENVESDDAIDKKPAAEEPGNIATIDTVNLLKDPVKWSFKPIKKDDNNWQILLAASIEKGWHIYSMHISDDDGPIPTSFDFVQSDSYSLNGEILEGGNLLHEFDSAFGVNLSYIKDTVYYLQSIWLKKSAAIVKGTLEFMVCNDRECLPPEQIEFEVKVGGAQNGAIADEENDSTDKSLWTIFIAGFIGGLLALLTPCVFPMIPLTVSFFTKQSKNKTLGIRNAIIYGLSIIIIYVLLAFGVTKIFGANAMNALSTNVWFNIAFFVLFVVFAISFFGAFEIRLPSSWINKADRASDKGGVIGIFFMAFTLSLVSFSCTGPIIGTLLVEAAVHGGIIGPVTGMLGFSLALAFPFGLFAAFPGWLQSIPKSGSWLNTIKVSLGFLELAFALKFLSNADLVIQSGILKREIFLALWIGIFMMWTLYLLGTYRFSNDSETTQLSIGRVLLALLTLTFTIYLIPGLWGAPLKIISGFPPPLFYSESPAGFGTSDLKTASDDNKITVGDPKHCPHNLPCFHDYSEGMEYAKQVDKPVMLDFTGWACVNCRKMEENVWSDPRVLQRLRDDVVLISLYVDEKTSLPENEQIVKQLGGKDWKINTVGNKWSYMQASVYGTNSQPYYVLIDHNEKMLNQPTAYNSDIQHYIDWLDEGVHAFKDNKHNKRDNN